MWPLGLSTRFWMSLLVRWIPSCFSGHFLYESALVMDFLNLPFMQCVTHLYVNKNIQLRFTSERALFIKLLTQRKGWLRAVNMLTFIRSFSCLILMSERNNAIVIVILADMMKNRAICCVASLVLNQYVSTLGSHILCSMTACCFNAVLKTMISFLFRTCAAFVQLLI